ncbi:MAG: glycosyltransferase family 2 protein [Desulfuromonadaceae bacterium]|nr:glycosyltransferase family 2 protein [Desulfuromonadaceae bacterium]
MVSSILWNNELLEPVIITYNRSQCLERTIQAFQDAGLGSMKLHVLDNASTDSTRSVVEKFQKNWPLLTYHRNTFNIGGNANILRAVELSQSEYFWVIGDDDLWLFGGIAELQEKLVQREADIIRLGWLVDDKSRGKIVESLELAWSEKFFFASLSMISSVIVRREIFVRNLPYCYMNIADSYPQMVPFYKTITSSSLKCYTLINDVVTHTPDPQPGYFMGDLEWHSAYIRGTRFLDNSDLRSKAVRELMDYTEKVNNRRFNMFSHFKNFFYLAMKSKAYGFDQMPYLLNMLCYAQGYRGIIGLLVIVYLSMPTWLVRFLVMGLRRYCKLTTDVEEVRRFFLEGRSRRL